MNYQVMYICEAVLLKKPATSDCGIFLVGYYHIHNELRKLVCTTLI